MTQQKIQERKPWSLWLFRAVLFVAGAAMVVAGVANGETGTVLQKAVNICLECIGIG